MKPSWERPRSSSARTLSRRDLLVLGGSALLLAGCSTVGQGPSRPTAGSATPEPYTGPTHTVDSLVSTTPFFIAHRGSGDNWAEHTMEAYSEAVALGAKAIEVSVNATKDGVLICHHDKDM